MQSSQVDRLEFCEGLGFLLLMLGVVYLGLFYYTVLKPFAWPWLARITSPIAKRLSPCTNRG